MSDMKRLVLTVFLIFIGFGFLSFARAQDYNYPLGFTPEDLSSLNSYISEEGIGGGGELSIYGADYSSFLKDKLGDFITFKAPDIHLGVTVNKKKSVAFYLAPTAKVFFSPGFGKAVRAYLRYNGKQGFGLTTSIYLFYTLPFKVLLQYEYSTIYIGFKSRESNFNKDKYQEVLTNTYKLFGKDNPFIVGFYYSWSLFGASAIAIESDLKNIMVNFHFGGKVL